MKQERQRYSGVHRDRAGKRRSRAAARQDSRSSAGRGYARPCILAIRNSENVFNRLALRVLHDGVIEFLAADHINDRAIHQRLLGLAR